MAIFTFRNIDPYPVYVPGSSFSEAFSISPGGQYIVGTVGEKPDRTKGLLAGKYYGFLTSVDDGFDAFAFYDYPNNIGGATSAVDVNDTGDVVGFYRVGTNQSNANEIHSYLWRHTRNRPDALDAPSAVFRPIDSPMDDLHNAALGMARDYPIVVGVFKDQDGKDYGFLGAPTFYTKIDVTPFAAGVKATRVTGVNLNLDIVGTFDDASGTHGFKWGIDHDDYSPTGRTTVNEPDLIDVSDEQSVVTKTSISGINDQNWIVGNYTTDDGNQHGFIWKPAPDGTYRPGKHKPIDFPGSSLTSVNGIAKTGVFVGYYRDTLGRRAFRGYLLPDA